MRIKSELGQLSLVLKFTCSQMRASLLTVCDCGSPHLAGMGKTGSDRNSSCDYPWHENQHLGSCYLEDKDSKSQQGLLEVYQSISSNPQGSQGTGYTHEPRGSSLRIPDPCLGKPTAFSTSSSSHPAAKGTRNHGLEAHLQLQIGKYHKVATTQAGGMALSPCHRFLNVDSNMETGIQKQGESWTLENHAAWSHL